MQAAAHHQQLPRNLARKKVHGTGPPFLSLLLRLPNHKVAKRAVYDDVSAVVGDLIPWPILPPRARIFSTALPAGFAGGFGAVLHKIRGADQDGKADEADAEEGEAARCEV